MAGNFIGLCDNAVGNNRITIPARFKKDFAPSAKDTVVITLGQDDDYLVIFPLDYWDELSKKFSSGNENQRRALKSYLNYADLQKLEPNGRIRVKSDIMKLAGIERDITIKGEGGYITVWDYSKFHSFRDNTREAVKNNKETDLFL